MDRLSASTAGDDASRRAVRLHLHGQVVDLRCTLPGVRQMIHDLLHEQMIDDVPEGFHLIEGLVEAYDADVVARHMSPSADRVAVFGDDAELWRDGERCWLIDDAWGLSEINLLKRTWRSWVLPQSQLDPYRTFEQAVLWPMSQILITRGLCIVPAASIVHRGRGILLLSPFSLEPELSTLADAGQGIIGQRWTALREEDGRTLLLELPGRIERCPIPQLRSRVRAGEVLSPILPRNEWTDLRATAGVKQAYAWCDLVLIVEPGRRAMPGIKPLTGASATAVVKRLWPIPDTGVAQKHSQTATRVGQQSAVYQIELSRDPRALQRLLEQIPASPSERQKLLPSIHLTPPRVAG
jgi:hypothetical protein